MVPFGPTRVQNLNGIQIDSAVFAGLTTVTDRLADRPTDHATPSVTIGRIYVVLRCSLIMLFTLPVTSANFATESCFDLFRWLVVD